MPLVAVMRDARLALAFDEAQWDALIRVCWRGNLLARLAFSLREHNALDEVPPAARRHLQAALVRHERQAVAMRFEIRALAQVLAAAGVRLVLLKGAAYLAQDHPASRGRLFSDIDILVPQARLDAVESALLQAGWHMPPLGRHDEHYYRQWMHELPPMQHRRRGTVLDVHHTLVPRTARIRLGGDALLHAARPAAMAGVWVLSDIDQVLHSACHGFFESEHQNGLRDGLDFLSLLETATAQAGGWAALVARARLLGLEPVLGRILAVCAAHLGLTVPEAPAAALGPHLRCGPMARWLAACALLPNHPLIAPPGAGVARWLLLARGHWLRMPATLLARHALAKALGAVAPARSA